MQAHSKAAVLFDVTIFSKNGINNLKKDEISAKSEKIFQCVAKKQQFPYIFIIPVCFLDSS